MQVVSSFRRKGVSGGNKQGWQLPLIGMICPHCEMAAWFSFDPPLSNDDVHEKPRRAPCGGCGQQVYFFVLRKPQRDKGGWLYIDPPREGSGVARDEVRAALENIAPALGDAYVQAVGALGSSLPGPATTEARRTLEGLVKHLLLDAEVEIDDRAMLGKLLKDLPQHIDLGAPLKETAGAIRAGGNLAAHFDMTRSADPAVATEALGLVEALVDYLLILPERVRHLHGLLEPQDEVELSATDSES